MHNTEQLTSEIRQVRRIKTDAIHSVLELDRNSMMADWIELIELFAATANINVARCEAYGVSTVPR